MRHAAHTVGRAAVPAGVVYGPIRLGAEVAVVAALVEDRRQDHQGVPIGHRRTELGSCASEYLAALVAGCRGGPDLSGAED